MKVDNKGVDDGLVSVEAAHDLVKKAISNVENASSSLDSRLRGSISGFSGVISLLNSVSSTTLDVMIKCNEYISDTLKTVLFIQGLSPEVLGDITNADILGLGKGPINSDFLSDADIEAIKDKKGQEEYKKELVKRGYTEKDAERLINREISSSELYQEIYQEYCNGDSTRFQPLIESALLSNMYFVRDESSNRKTEIETSIAELETGKSAAKKESELYKKVVDGAKYDSKTKKYTYKDDNGVVHEFDQKSFDAFKVMQENAVTAEEAYSSDADKQIELYEQELKTIDADLSDTSKEDFSYRTIEDMDARLAEIEAREKEIDRKISYGHSGADALKNESAELEIERKKLLEIKESIASNISLILDNAKYTWQSDFEEKSGLDKEKTREITHFDNGGNIVVNIFGIEDGKYTFMDSDEYRGALLARMINGDATVIPDFQGSALNVVGDSQEFYFYGNERQLLFSEYRDWINASTDKGEDEAAVIYPQEKEIFNYICNTQGYAAGYEYLKGKESEFDARFHDIQVAEDTARAKSNPWLGAVSLFLAPIEAIVNAGKISTRKSSGQNLHYYDSYSSANTWNATISSDVHKQNDVLGYVYDTLYSTDRIMMASVATYATGGGMLGSIGVNALLYGAPTFTSSVYNAKVKNIDDDRAIRFALVSATARTLSTSYMLSKATGLEDTFNDLLTSGQAMSKISGIVSNSKILSSNPEFSKNLLLTAYCMGTQGAVSGQTAVIDQTLISAADILINGDMSDAQIKYNNYKMAHDGCSDFEAYMYVASDNMANSFSTFALAFGPGAILGGIKADGIIYHQKNSNQNINFEEAFEGIETPSLEPIEPEPSPDGWITVTPKSPSSDTYGENGGYYGYRRFGDYELMTSKSDNPDGTSGAAEVEYQYEIQLSLDENGNVVQTVNKIYVGGSNNGSSQGSIQQTKIVEVPSVTDQGSIQQIKPEMLEVATNPVTVDSTGVGVSNIANTVVNNNITIPGQSLGNNSFTVINNDSYVLPFAPTIPKVASKGSETGSTSRTDWYKSTGAFTPSQLAIASKIDDIEASINKNDSKVTEDDFDYLFEQSKLPIKMKDELLKTLQKNGSIVKDYASDTLQDTTSSDENLYHIDTMPLSEIPKRQEAIDKLEKGEKLTIGDKIALGGRDHVVKEIDGYQLKPDHVYRVTDIKAWAEYVKNGKIVSNKPEFKIGENNGGVDWYLGGAASPTGKYSSGADTIVIEAPADKTYFTPSIDNGLGMADDYHVRHMKSSTQANPVPLSMVKVIKGQDVIDNWESVESFKKNLGDAISSVITNQNNTFTVKTKYGEEFTITKDGLNSQNFEYEIKQLNEHHEALLVNDWLLNHIDNIDSLIINDSERQKNIDNYIAKIAKYLGTDSETFKQVYASTFKRIIDESDIGIRVSNDSLLKILTSGEIKNSHTTESERLDTSEERKQHEEYLFGIPKEIEGQDSPIYGMVFPKYDENDSKSVQFYNYGPGYWYGKGNGELDYSTEAVIILKKDAILDYTTFTNADSLEHGRDPELLSRYGGIQAPTNAKNPIQTNSWFGMEGIKSIEDLRNATLYNFSPLENHDTDGYIETQIYGRYNHSIDNIDHVIFLKAPSMEVVSKLNELGIKYIIAHHEENIHNKYTVINSNGEEITVDAIGVTRDANGVYHDGVMSTFNGVFTERDNVQLEFGGEKRHITIGDISEALNIMTDLITLKKPTNLSETMRIIQETVDMYFGDYSSLETRFGIFSNNLYGYKPRDKVSDFAHQNAATGIERSMLAQNLLKQLGYDSTFKMSEIDQNGIIANQAFNVIHDNGKYYIFDSAQPTLRNGKIDPIVCEISADVALKMLDPLSSDGVSLSISRNYNALIPRYSNVIYDAGWPRVEYGYSGGDFVTGFNLRAYRMREMTDLLSMLGSAEIDLKERVSHQIKNIIINDPLMLPSYMYKLDDLMPSDKLDLLQMASTTDKYQTLLHSFDISQESDLYVNHKEELMKIYQNIYNQIIEGKIDYHQFIDSTVPVFKELDPLYPIKNDINDAIDGVREGMYSFRKGQSFIYLLDYSKEILDYSIENNIKINDNIIIYLLKDEVENPESLIKLLSSGNYDRSAFDILGMRIMGDKNLIALVASNHPEYLNGYEFNFYLDFKEKNDNLEDIKFILDKTKNIDGITYTINANTNNQHTSELNEFLKELHSIVGDKLLIRPWGNTNSATHTYTYDDFIYRDSIIETYVSALRDKVDVNGNIKSLSPFEKFFAAFIITEKFAKYNLEGFRYDSDLTRSVYEFINKHDNRPICCAGYVSFLHELLERLVYSDGKLNLAHWSVNSKSETNATVDYDNHDRSLAYLEDLKYKLNAIFMSDPTWDSNKFFATRSPDFRRTVVRHLLKTRDELSTEKSDFSDPLRNMHIESDDDINRIRIDLGLDDSISNEEIISLFNQKITDEQLIYALCAINRFVEKGAPMAKSNSIGQDGYTVDEFNRAVLSLGLEEKFIFDESLTHKSLNEIIKYLDDEYHLDKYEAVCLINEYFTKHNTSDSRLVLSLSSDNQVELDHIYSAFYAKDLDVLFNLPEDLVDEVMKKLNLGLSTESIITLGKYDLSKSLDGISIPSSTELDEIVKIKQAQAHDVLIETMKTDLINKQKMERRQKAEEARIRLDEIAREKGMTLKELGKQTGDVDPEIKRIADSLAEEVAEKAKSNQKRFEKLVKIYDNGELSGRTFESIQEGIKDGTITEYQVLVGLDRQLKEVSSISRKIIDYAEKHVDNSLSDGASRVHDSLRYTLLIDDDHYVQKIHEVVDDLRDKGYIVNVSNHWGNPAYQGVNATITDRETSFTFELQFHTAESFDAKESVTHTYYEIFRNKYTTAEEKDLANTIQMSAQEDVSVPKGIIGEKFD